MSKWASIHQASLVPEADNRERVLPYQWVAPVQGLICIINIVLPSRRPLLIVITIMNNGDALWERRGFYGHFVWLADAQS